MSASLIKLKVELLFTDLNEYDLKWSQTFKEISKIQKECNHLYDDETSAIEYNSTDTMYDFYKCKVCQKIFKCNPHKK